MWLKKCQLNWILQTLLCFSTAPLFSLSMLICLLSSRLAWRFLLHLKAIWVADAYGSVFFPFYSPVGSLRRAPFSVLSVLRMRMLGLERNWPSMLNYFLIGWIVIITDFRCVPVNKAIRNINTIINNSSLILSHFFKMSKSLLAIKKVWSTSNNTLTIPFQVVAI